MQKRFIIIISSVILTAVAVLAIYKITAGINHSKSPANIKNEAQARPDVFSPATEYEKKFDLIKARDEYRKIIEKSQNTDDIAKAVELLNNLNIRILFSPIVTPDSVVYEIRKGDTLAKIAKKFNTTMDLISKANGLKNTNIKFGRPLKITRTKFTIAVDKPHNILTLQSGGNIVKTYRISTGANNSTPVGTFTITNKIVYPVWYTEGAVVPSESPKNILGSRWMGISKKGYGIHGTTEPQAIGASVTAGCVRMKNEDVEELYTIVPEGTEVIIMD